MKIIKVMNNSLLLVKDEYDNEIVVMGKGIGFRKKAGEYIEEDKVEKIFVPKNQSNSNEYIRLIEETSNEYIEIVNYIINHAKEKLGVGLSNQIFFTLLDHISYSIKRLEKNIIIQNRLVWEVKKFYSKEFEVGLHAVNYINERLNISLPEEEAANIAFHLVNAQIEGSEMENTINTVKMLKDIFNIVQYNFNISINTDSINYSRFITHLQFFIQRLVDDRMNESSDNFIFNQMKKEYKSQYSCAKLIGEYIKNTMDKNISDEELLYLTIHIVRLTER